MRRAAITLAVTVVIVLALGAGAFTLMNSRTTQVDGEIVSRVETDEKVVALTFDDGPAAEDADALLSTLESRRVPATFYVIGKEASREIAVMRRLVRDGHEIGNHTWSHPRMVFVSTDEIAEEVESTDRAIRDSGYTGRRTIDATRPGSIILLHPWNGRTTTQKAIGPIIDGLRDEGYRFVTVSELTG